MTTLELKLNLPDQLAEEAKKAGLLRPEEIESMLRERLRRKHLEELRQSMDKMQSGEAPPMTIEQIQAEVKAYRQERRRASGS
jgi:CCR4-NOT transcriptional regulation complex NOT5 subunit